MADPNGRFGLRLGFKTISAMQYQDTQLLEVYVVAQDGYISKSLPIQNDQEVRERYSDQYLTSQADLQNDVCNREAESQRSWPPCIILSTPF